MENAWYNYISDGEDLLNKVTTRSEVKHFSDEVIDLSKETLISQPSKKRKLLDSTKNDNDINIISPPPSSAPPRESSQFAQKPVQNVEASYWESTEARKLFRPIAKERDALEGVDNQIELLCYATSTPNGYLTLIDRREKTNNNEDDRMSDFPTIKFGWRGKRS